MKQESPVPEEEFADLKAVIDYLNNQPTAKKSLVLQTKICKTLERKSEFLTSKLNFFDKTILAKTNGEIRAKLLTLDDLILRKAREHSTLLEIVNSVSDVEIIISSDHPLLKFARKWLGIHSPLDINYDSFLARLDEYAKRTSGMYASKFPRIDLSAPKTAEYLKAAEEARAMYRDFQNKIAIRPSKPPVVEATAEPVKPKKVAVAAKPKKQPTKQS